MLKLKKFFKINILFWILFLLPLCCYTHCSGKEGKNIEDHLYEYCDRVVPAVCGAIFACCDANQRGVFDTYASEEICLNTEGSTCRTNVETIISQNDPDIAYDSDGAQELLASIEAAVESCDIPHKALSFALTPRRAIIGTAPAGTQCSPTDELPACEDICMPVGDTDAWECTDGAAVGESCQLDAPNFAHGCTRGLVCVHDVADYGICSELLEEGDPCDHDYQCRSYDCNVRCENYEICSEPP